MSDFNFKDIRETQSFKRGGYTYTKVAEKDGWYLFKMEKKDITYLNYELVRGIKRKNPDETLTMVYPSAEQFGTYGYYFCGTPEIIRKNMEKRAKKNGFDWTYFYPLVG